MWKVPKKKTSSVRVRKDRLGEKVRNLTIIDRRVMYGRNHWVFECGCGKRITAQYGNVARNTGYKTERKPRGCVCGIPMLNKLKYVDDPVYKLWDQINSMAYNGEITLDGRWVDFSIFYYDMKDKLPKEYDRIDRVYLDKPLGKNNYVFVRG